MIVAFVLVVIPVLLVPGPDLLLVLRQTALQGRATGGVTAAGSCAGLLLHATAAVLGLAALVAASTVAFTAVKVLGAAYLVYLGVQSLRAARARPTAATTATGPPEEPDERWRRRAFGRGLLTNALNPKIAVFFVALLPQFVTPASSPTGQAALLGAIFIAMSVMWLAVVVFTASAASTVLRRDSVRRRLDALSGVVFLGFASRLPFTRL